MSSLGQGVFDDFTPWVGVVEWAHLMVHDTFIVDFHYLILHHHLSQGQFSIFNEMKAEKSWSSACDILKRFVYRPKMKRSSQ